MLTRKRATFQGIVFLLSLLTALGSSIQGGGGEAKCSIPQEQLQAARLKAVVIYVQRLNHDVKTYNLTCQRFYTEDVRFLLRGIGTFDSYQVATEYGFLLFNTSAEIWQGTIHAELDLASIRWQGRNNNTASFWHTAEVNLGPDPSQPGKFFFSSGGVRNYQTVIFEECSDRIKADIVVSDRDIIPIYDAHNEIDAMTLCKNIMARCTGSLQQYRSVDECVGFMQAIGAVAQERPRSACPYRLTSNTTTCRNFHSSNTLVDPAVHCPHTAKDSVMCVDNCLPACESCPPNSHCSATYSNATSQSAIYSCACDAGFVAFSTGDGEVTKCLPASCNDDGECGKPFGYCDRDSGRCACKSTSEWVSSGSKVGCTCPEDYTITWDIPVPNHSNLTSPSCRPPGGCLAREHCTQQAKDRVQCRATDPPSTVSSWLACLCNPGFIGGWNNPCTCPYGESQVAWSSKLSGEVCLAPGQCSNDRQCKTTCVMPPEGFIGTCQPA